MKYSKAIIPFFILSIFIVVLLFNFANKTRSIEKKNYNLSENIKKIKEQININEIEFSLYVSYDYLNQLKKIYFEENYSEKIENRISFNDIKNKNLENFYTIGTR